MYDEIKLLALFDKFKINRENAIEFDRRAQFNGLSISRRIRYWNVFKMINNVLKKDLRELKQEDIDTFFLFMRAANYADESKRCTWIIFRKIVKHFVKLKFRPYKQFLKRKYKHPAEVLTKEDMLQMFKVCKNAREKSIIGMLFNSGCRPGEFCSLKTKNIISDSEGITFKVDGKTGERTFRVAEIIPCFGVFIEYMNERESFKISTLGLWKLLKRIGIKAGIEKRITPHMFRHSCATFLANHLTEAQMCAYFGWVQGSCMTRIYVHLSARDIGPKIIDVNNLLREKSVLVNQSLANHSRMRGVPMMAQSINRDDSGVQLTLLQAVSRA